MFSYSGSILLYGVSGPYWVITVGGFNVIYNGATSSLVASPLALPTNAVNYSQPLIFNGSTCKSSLTLKSILWTGLPIPLGNSYYLQPSGIGLSYCDASMLNPIPIPEIPAKIMFNGMDPGAGSNYLLAKDIFLDWRNNAYAIAGNPWTLCMTFCYAAIGSAVAFPASDTARPWLKVDFESALAL